MSSAQAVEMAKVCKNCFKEELICSICLHVLVDPVQLPCKHNFCHGCISEAWAKDVGILRCPECNQPYKQNPSLEKNIKLINIMEKFNALNTEKEPAVLRCILCRRGPVLPAQKVCLCCNAPCCQSHIQTHLQQPSSNAGHLLVDVEDVRAWSCPQHDEYRLYHCETEQVAVCRYCCFSRCAVGHGHGVCDVELRQNDIRDLIIMGYTMGQLWRCLLLLSCCVLCVHSHGDHHGQASRDPHPPITRLDKNMVQDKDHIMEHLDGVIDKPELDMTPQELQLHYFKMHDYDGNNLLDGLELATAITHVHKEEKGENSPPMKEQDLISIIDQVLRDDDKNNDGYIDYAEFAKSLQ